VARLGPVRRLAEGVQRLSPRRRHPLGEGLWRADFERVDRASRRVLQVLPAAGLDEPTGQALVERLRAARERVWQGCLTAHDRAPAADAEVPGDPALASAHHAFSRTATSVAQAAQALVMSGDGPGRAASAGRALGKAEQLAAEAAAALAGDAGHTAADGVGGA
jgi:hypothetical protein